MFKPKTARREYDPSMLPGNRREVFWDVVKLHYGKLMMCGCLMLLFALPIHALAVAEDFYRIALNRTIEGVTDVEKIAQAYSSLLLFRVLRNAVNIPLLALLAVGLAGMSRVIRQFAWGESVEFNHDFSLGVKQNVRQYALLALFTGIVVFILDACLQFNNICVLLKLRGVPAVEPNDAYDWLSVIPVALCAVFFIPILGYAAVAASCYENRLRDNLKIGRVCYFKRLWKTLLACVCCLAIFMIQMLPFLWCHLVGRIAASLLIPAIMLGWFLFALGGLDEAVNRRLHPELVGKGILGPGDERAARDPTAEHGGAAGDRNGKPGNPAPADRAFALCGPGAADDAPAAPGGAEPAGQPAAKGGAASGEPT